jgi:hypothetical protein
MPAYPSPTPDAFVAAESQFHAIVAHLAGAPGLAMEHDAAERYLDTHGRALLCSVLQGFLDTRAAQQIPSPAVRGDDGVGRSHRRGSSRSLETVFGSVYVTRFAYSARGAGARHPLDAELNLPRERYSFGVRQRVAAWASRLSFDEVVTELGRSTGAHVPKRQTEQLVVRAAADFDAFYATRDAPAASESLPELMVLTFDGKGIPMRVDDLRAKTQAAAQCAQRLKHRLRGGEKKHRKRMAQVAAVYGVARFARAPEDIVRELRPLDEPLPARPRPIAKRVWASVEQESAEVIKAAFAEAQRRDPQGRARWVVLLDGNPSQLELVRAQAAANDVEITPVLDVIHVLEYVWRAAYVFFPAGSREAETWVSEQLLGVCDGRVSRVAAGMRRSATHRELDAETRAAVDDCADYLLRYKALLRYDEFLADGLPIATGVIEGACRYLVKDRMERTGARWRLKGAEAVLKLRALHASGDFDAYWNFHVAREFARNHAARYAANELQRAAA